jgi:hypothetical protein
VEQLDAAIAAVGLHLRLPGTSQPLGIHDVQIWSDGGITCRLHSPAPADVNGSLDTERAGQSVQE